MCVRLKGVDVLIETYLVRCPFPLNEVYIVNILLKKLLRPGLLKGVSAIRSSTVSQQSTNKKTIQKRYVFNFVLNSSIAHLCIINRAKKSILDSRNNTGKWLLARGTLTDLDYLNTKCQVQEEIWQQYLSMIYVEARPY